MDARPGTLFRLMTYNIGGGRKDFGSVWDSVIAVIRDISPDILFLQEAIEWWDVDQNTLSLPQAIGEALDYMQGIYFGPALSMQEQFHPGKATFVHGVFHDYREWRQGNAVLSRWGFSRMADPSRVGEPWNIPLFRPPQYEGNRDTDPRCAILCRVSQGGTAPFVIGTHLSTLVGEAGRTVQIIPGKAELAREMRNQQLNRLLDLIRTHLLETNELVFLAGDFNAMPEEGCIADLLERQAGFQRLIPENGNVPTHLFKVPRPIDHLFVYPARRLIEYHCRIVDTPLARQASDHLPVVADVWVA